jgi:uncharacterized protein (TIGR02001 family)
VKKQIALITGIATIAGLSAGSALALDVTANAGAVSEYVFRGLPQTDGSAAAQGGIDLAQGNFSFGSWASTVKSAPELSIDSANPDQIVSTSGNNGLEVDFYGGYGNSIGAFSIVKNFALYSD